MAGKKLSARCTDEQYLRIVRDAETVGVTVSEFIVTAALNIGARAESAAMESAALSAILERLDDLENRFGNTSPSNPIGTQDGPNLAEIGEAIADLYAGQKRVQIEQERTNETLENLVHTVGKIFDHLARSATQSAPPAAARPVPNQAPTTEPKAEAFRRCRPGTAFDEFRLTDEQPRPDREDFYRRHLARIVQSVGWDSKVPPEHYAWANLTPPAGLYDQ